MDYVRLDCEQFNKLRKAIERDLWDFIQKNKDKEKVSERIDMWYDVVSALDNIELLTLEQGFDLHEILRQYSELFAKSDQK